MAFPTANWANWSQPSIEPFMEMVIHFPSGDVTIYDGGISSVSIDGRMFDSSSVLFGPPEPAEASIELVDFDQKYNPVLNTELVAGIEVELFLGLRGVGDSLGPGRIIQWDDDTQVIYNNETVWATVFHTEHLLEPGHRFLLEYQYLLEDPAQSLDVGELITERIEIPYEWFDRTIYAITHDDQKHYVMNAQLREILGDLESYGVFVAREWSYDTVEHIATIDCVDRMNEALMLDNRADSLLPSTNVDLRTFATTLINLYGEVPSDIASDVYTTDLLFSFYEETQASTISNLVQACQATYFFLPDGTSVFSPFDGAYDTGITITDEDVITYDIKQTSAVSYDYVSVEQASVYLEQTKVIDYKELDLSTHPWIPYTTPRLYHLEYVLATATDGLAHWQYYTWNVTGLDYGILKWPLFEAYGTCVKATMIPVSTGTIGTLPYEVKGNYYIQTGEHAQAICNNIEEFLDLKYNTVEFTIAGCPSLWPGAQIHLRSDLYNIDEDYVVIELHYTYTGSISTTLVAQRRF